MATSFSSGLNASERIDSLRLFVNSPFAGSPTKSRLKIFLPSFTWSMPLRRVTWPIERDENPRLPDSERVLAIRPDGVSNSFTFACQQQSALDLRSDSTT